jgi:FkbM family methyltransferase
LALPFLNRLQFRLRSAIEGSEAAAAVSRVERLAEHLDARLERVLVSVERPESPEPLERLTRLEMHLDVIQRRLDRLDRLDRLSRIEEMLEAQAPASVSMSQRLDLLLQRNLVPFGDVMAIRTDVGYLFAPVEDNGLVLYLLEARGRLEPGTSAVLEVLGGPGCTVIDVGANVGMHTLPMARRVGPAGRVLALEAAPRMADLLRRTIELNGLDWVELHPVAASDRDGTLRFNVSAHTSLSSVLPLDGATETIDIPARRLDTLVAPGERVDLVKIDVEGAELQVWQGMQRIVADNPDIALVLEFGPSHLAKAGQSVSGWFEALQSTGLTAWEIDEASGGVRPLRGEGLAEVFSINILLLRGAPSSRGLRTS